MVIYYMLGEMFPLIAGCTCHVGHCESHTVIQLFGVGLAEQTTEALTSSPHSGHGSLPLILQAIAVELVKHNNNFPVWCSDVRV